MAKQVHHMRLMARMAASSLEDMVCYNESQIRPLTEDQKGTLEQVGQVCESSIMTAMSGLSAIGETLAGIGAFGDSVDEYRVNPDILTNDRLAGLGFLIQGLAEMAEEARDAEIKIAYIKRQQVG